jgi:hypothetical protein
MTRLGSGVRFNKSASSSERKVFPPKEAWTDAAKAGTVSPDKTQKRRNASFERGFNIVNLPTMKPYIIAATLLTAVAYAQTPLSSADGPFQIRYAANSTRGDSYIDISNDGASMTTTTILSGTNTLAVSGSICINAYAFDAAEEILSCCSCPVTPNGLVSLSVQRDLLNNTLSGRATPSSIVIKLVATRPPGAGVGTSSNPCGTAASSVNLGNLANGMVAWGTSLHQNTSSVTST